MVADLNERVLPGKKLHALGLKQNANAVSTI
jgi:hypothetical protein